ncbi:MAG: hypothetical protein HKN40_10340 [Winogradskyella sp.]|uniref:hypothetical protein n=1 Tax=Winogradskyella sp. TaxID=1883156 RepID=UPI0018046CD4|nr:hypothetical protein [Winogradskyella sp.]
MNYKTVILTVTKGLALLLVLTILLPSAVKLTHAFNHQTHDVCESDDEAYTHFHQSDLDCNFYKFKLTENQFYAVFNYKEQLTSPFLEQALEHYISFNNHQQLSNFLRGPPQLV